MTAKSEIIKLYKKLGETPLESLYRFKLAHPEYQKIKMTYLGRLDPLAEGLLLVLAGDTRNKEKYLSWDKSYNFEVLWGFETDTYDLLGLVVGQDKTPASLERKMPTLLKKISLKKTQSYPPYSSKTVSGKPLFVWARENRIEEINIPDRRIKIFSIEHLHTRHVSGQEILDEVSEKVSLVKGDFRQKEILRSWHKSLKTKRGETFLISRFKADVSSGTYVRGLAHEMAKMLDTVGLALSIKRTRVGEYHL